MGKLREMKCTKDHMAKASERGWSPQRPQPDELSWRLARQDPSQVEKEITHSIVETIMEKIFTFQLSMLGNTDFLKAYVSRT